MVNIQPSPTQATRTDRRGTPAPGPGASSGPSDEALIAGLAAGRLEALDALYERYGSTAYGLARRITADDGLAADALEAAFLGVWRAAATLAPDRRTARAWLLTMVHDHAIEAVRRRRAAGDPADKLEGVRPLERRVSLETWDEVRVQPGGATVVAALAHLPVDERRSLEMAYFDGLSESEIATRTGVPVRTVRSRLRLALMGLRGELERRCTTAASR